MDLLWSLWRYDYITGSGAAITGGCVFCDILINPASDEEKFILHRAGFNFVILNIYPYVSGHLMVVPYRHTADFPGLSADELGDITALLQRLSVGLTSLLRPDGFNVGSNIGRTAGAGIDQHLHFHIVPRWSGDTNFMPVLDDTKMISEDMKETWSKLRAHLHG